MEVVEGKTTHSSDMFGDANGDCELVIMEWATHSKTCMAGDNESQAGPQASAPPISHLNALSPFSGRRQQNAASIISMLCATSWFSYCDRLKVLLQMPFQHTRAAPRQTTDYGSGWMESDEKEGDDDGFFLVFFLGGEANS